MSTMNQILPWLLLKSRVPGSDVGGKLQPYLNTSFLLSHLEGNWSGCGAVLALFGPSYKPGLSYFLLHGFGRGTFSMLSH